MKENSKNTINLIKLNHHLGSMGFLYPMDELELDLFEKLYADFDFKLKDATIDVTSIIKNQLTKKSVIQLSNEINPNEINELKMAARKGSQDLSQEIIDKMYGKHRKKSDDKE